MTAKPSIDPALRWIEQIDRAEPDLIRALLKTFVEALMHGEADAICGAGYGVRSNERVNVRNGYRGRHTAGLGGQTPYEPLLQKA
jgi:putative transposase